MKILSLFLVLSLINFSQAKSPSLSDLGFSNKEIKVDPVLTKKLEKRKWMLNAHQYTAIGSLALMTGAMLTGGHGKSTSTHKWLGIAGGAAYYTAASFAIFAPEVKGHKTTGNTLWHERLSWIHIPAMILAPTLGYLANKKYDKGETPSGIIGAHSTFAKVGYFSMLAAAATMTFEF